MTIFAKRPTRTAIEAIAAQVAGYLREAGLAAVATTLIGTCAAVAGTRTI